MQKTVPPPGLSTRHGVPSSSDWSEHWPNPSVVVVSVTLVAGALSEEVVAKALVVEARVENTCAVVVAGLCKKPSRSER